MSETPGAYWRPACAYCAPRGAARCSHPKQAPDAPEKEPDVTDHPEEIKARAIRACMRTELTDAIVAKALNSTDLVTALTVAAGHESNRGLRAETWPELSDAAPGETTSGTWNAMMSRIVTAFEKRDQERAQAEQGAAGLKGRIVGACSLKAVANTMVTVEHKVDGGRLLVTILHTYDQPRMRTTFIPDAPPA